MAVNAALSLLANTFWGAQPLQYDGELNEGHPTQEAPSAN